MDTIETLKAQLGHEESVLSDLKGRTQSALMQMLATKRSLIELIHNIREGLIVSYRGKLHKVTKVEVKSWSQPESKPWVHGNPMKKDGTYGTAERNLYSDWTLES